MIPIKYAEFVLLYFKILLFVLNKMNNKVNDNTMYYNILYYTYIYIYRYRI